MRHLLFATFCILLACCAESPAERTLGRASSLLPEYPDSAEVVLNSIPAGSGEAEDARIALYRVWIANRRGDNLSNDSLLETANTYFRDHRDELPRDRMILNYLKGLSRLERKNYGGAIISLLQAEELAQQLDDNHHLGLIYRYMALTYQSLSNHINEISYCKQSLKHFQKGSNKEYVSYAVNDLAIAFNNAGKYTEAEKNARKALALAKEESDTILELSSLGVLGTIYIATDQYQKCRNLLEKLDLHYGLSEANDIRNYGTALLYTGNMKGAIECNKLLKSIDSTDVLLDYRINFELQNYELALNSLKTELNTQDKLLTKIFEQTADEQVSRYLKKREIEATNAIIQGKRKTTYILFASIIIIFCGICIYTIHNHRLRKRMDKQIAEIQELKTSIIYYKDNLLRTKEQLSENINTVSALEHQIQEKQEHQNENKTNADIILTDRFALIEKLCNSYYECKGTSSEKTKLYNKVIELISDLKNNGVIANSIESIINACYNNIIDDLRNNYDKFTENEIRLYIFIISKFSIRAISAIMDMSVEAVYNRKTRLKKKISSICTDADRYISLM